MNAGGHLQTRNSRAGASCPMFELFLKPRKPPVTGLVILQPRTEGQEGRGGHSPKGPSVDCRWFVETYSEYRDGRLGLAVRTAVQAHMASCEACRRYDRVIRTGVSVLREEDAPAPSRSVGVTRLRNRAWAIENRESMALGSAGSGITTLGVALVAIVLGSFAWLPLVGAGTSADATPEFELAPIVAAVPESSAPPRLAIGLRSTRMSLSVPLALSDGRSPGFTVSDHLPLKLQRERSSDDVIWPPLVLHGSSWFARPNTPGLAAGVDPD